MQTIELTINKELKAVGNLPIPSGSILVATIVALDFIGGMSVAFDTSLYIDNESKLKNESVAVKNMTRRTPGGFNLENRSIIEGVCTCSENEGVCKSEYSLGEVKEAIKTKVAKTLGIEVKDIV